VHYLSKPSFYNKRVDRCFGQAVIAEENQVGYGIQTSRCVSLDSLGFFVNCFFAYLLFELKSKSGSDVLNDTGCASLFKLFYITLIFMIDFINKEYWATAWSVGLAIE
jgi:hypothetical protein